MNHIRVGAVEYLNTKPLLYGLENSPMPGMQLSLDYPSRLVDQLLQGHLDLALVPVVTLLHPGTYVAGQYGIAADAAVHSVGLYSQLPMSEINKVYLDYQSRTSVMLAKILLKEYWKKEVSFIPAHEHFISAIQDDVAGVIIGDRAMMANQVFPFQYDLAEAWKLHTGLPFVFAAWIASKPLPDLFIQKFNAANRYGLTHLKDVIAQYADSPFDLTTYFTQYIQYELTEERKKGMDLFLQKVSTLW